MSEAKPNEGELAQSELSDGELNQVSGGKPADKSSGAGKSNLQDLYIMSEPEKTAPILFQALTAPPKKT